MTTKRAGRLAIDGGAPVRTTFLPYARQTIEAEDEAAVLAALRSDWLTTGPRIRELEVALEEVTGARHAVLFSSGTAALHGAMAVLDIAPGDEVVTTPMTFSATANATLYVGGEVRFADVRPDTLLLDPDAVRTATTPRTRAIVATDYAGQPADYGALRSVAEAAPGGPVALVADAAHSLGGSRAGVRVGQLADMTILSLHPAKIVTTGEGGAVLTDRDEWPERLRRFRNHGISTELGARRDWRYDLVELGYNYRLTDIGAALGLAQLGRLERFITRRQAIAARYREAFAGEERFDLPVTDPDVEHARHLYVVQLRLDRLGVDRAAVYAAMKAEGIGVNVHYIPVHQLSLYRERYPDVSMPVADAAYERMLTLPLFPAMTDGDVDDVVAAMTKVLDAYPR